MGSGSDKKDGASQAVWRQTGAISLWAAEALPQKLAQSGLIGGRFG